MTVSPKSFPVAVVLALLVWAVGPALAAEPRADAVTGPWDIVANGQGGVLTISGSAKSLKGTVKFHGTGAPAETLRDVRFEGGELKFWRPSPAPFERQSFKGALTTDADGKQRLEGRFAQVWRHKKYKPSYYKWHAVRPKGYKAPDPGDKLVEIAVDNKDPVHNKPTHPSTFQIKVRQRLVYLMTYHWNRGKGVTPTGRIGVVHTSGQLYGPWATRGRAGQGNVPNAYWECEPNVILEPGTYTVVDSDASTWAQNAASGHRGMFRVKLMPVGTNDPPPDDKDKQKTSVTTIIGPWDIVAGGRGVLTISGSAKSLKGTVKFHGSGGGPETLHDVRFEEGELRFSRPCPAPFECQEFKGTLKISGDGKQRLEGGFATIWRNNRHKPSHQKWHAVRPKGYGKK
jgi:hypothetical protein